MDLPRPSVAPVVSPHHSSRSPERSGARRARPPPRQPRPPLVRRGVLGAWPENAAIVDARISPTGVAKPPPATNGHPLIGRARADPCIRARPAHHQAARLTSSQPGRFASTRRPLHAGSQPARDLITRPGLPADLRTSAFSRPAGRSAHLAATGLYRRRGERGSLPRS